jgi:hypothetical protein
MCRPASCDKFGGIGRAVGAKKANISSRSREIVPAAGKKNEIQKGICPATAGHERVRGGDQHRRSSEALKRSPRFRE